MDGEIFTIRARRCKRCGRLLTSAEAVEKGYGCQCAAKGIFTCYEIKSCKEDVYSGNGLNFLGEKNYIVTTMECYKDILPDLRSGKFSKHMREQFPESSNYFGVMVAIPDWAEATDEFEKSTPLDAEVRQWKLAVILPCRYGPRKRSMTELLFCMLRSGH